MLSFTDPAVTVPEADAYAESRAWTNWTGTDDVKLAALRRGQDYIAGTYNGRWADEWENNAAPEQVKFAIIEAARLELGSPGSLMPTVPAGPQKVLTAVKGIQWTVLADREERKVALIPAVDALLASLVEPSAGNTTVTALARF